MARTLYYDSDFRVHVSNPTGERHAFEAPEELDGKCDLYLEGMRYVPHGKSWIRPDGFVFEGKMLSCAADSRVLSAYQEQYEANQTEMADMQEALALLGVTMDE